MRRGTKNVNGQYIVIAGGVGANGYIKIGGYQNERVFYRFPFAFRGNKILSSAAGLFDNVQTNKHAVGGGDRLRAVGKTVCARYGTGKYCAVARQIFNRGRRILFFAKRRSDKNLVARDNLQGCREAYVSNKIQPRAATIKLG